MLFSTVPGTVAGAMPATPAAPDSCAPPAPGRLLADANVQFVASSCVASRLRAGSFGTPGTVGVTVAGPSAPGVPAVPDAGSISPLQPASQLVPASAAL